MSHDNKQNNRSVTSNPFPPRCLGPHHCSAIVISTKVSESHNFRRNWPFELYDLWHWSPRACLPLGNKTHTRKSLTCTSRPWNCVVTALQCFQYPTITLIMFYTKGETSDEVFFLQTLFREGVK